MMCQYLCSLSMSDLEMLTFFFLLELNWRVTLLPFPYKGLEKVRGRRCMERGREGGREGVSEWMLAFLLRRPDIIKDSPCVLPLLSSKGTLAPGSSACYCVALAEKRLREWLWTAGEEEEGARGGAAQAVFPIYQQGGGYTNNSACFPTHVHANPSPALPYSLFSALSHTLPCSLTLTIFLSPTQYLSLSHSPVFLLRPLSLFTSSKQPPPPVSFPSISLLCRLSASCAVSSSPD